MDMEFTPASLRYAEWIQMAMESSLSEESSSASQIVRLFITG